MPSYLTNYGVRANTLRVQQQRAGLINATIGLIAKGETTPGQSTTVPAADAISGVARFAQASGQVRLDGVALTGVGDGSFSFTNNLDVIQAIRADKEIEDADPGVPAASGSVRLRFADHVFLNKAIGRVPVALVHEFVAGDYYLGFGFSRIFLPRPKRAIDGPNGVMATFNQQAAGVAGSSLMSVPLRGPAATYL